MSFIFGMIAGLIIGWNVFPQPAFVKEWIDTHILNK